MTTAITQQQRLRAALRDVPFQSLDGTKDAKAQQRSLMQRVLTGEVAYIVAWDSASSALNAIPPEECYKQYCCFFARCYLSKTLSQESDN